MAEISRTIKKEEEEMKQRRKRLMCLMLSAMLAVSTEAAALADEITVDTAVEDTVATQELPEESPEAEDAAPAEEDDLIAEPEDGSSETADGSEAGEGFEAEDTADTEDASSLTEFSGDGLIVGVEEVESPELAVYATSNSEEMTTEDEQFTYIVMTDDTTGAQTAAITGYAGEDAESVQEIRIPEKIGEIPVTEIWSDFSNCKTVESIYIPQYVVKLGYGVFALDGKNPKICSDKTPAYAINPDTSTFIAYDVSELNNYFSSLDGVLYNKKQSILYRCPVGKNAVTIPNTVNTLYSYSFSGCQINTPIILTSDIEIGSKAFYRSNLSSIAIGKGTSDLWNNSYECFAYAKITELSIEDGIKQFGAKNMFESVQIDAFRWPQSITFINFDPFSDNINQPEILIKNLYYEGSEPEWYDLKSRFLGKLKSEKIKNYFFSKEASIDELWQCIEFENKDGIKEARIKSCKKVSGDITIPSEWNGLKVTEIGERAFANNKQIKNVILPEGITNIRDNAFEGCTSLKSISIPDSVSKIGTFAFSGCTELTSISLPENLTELSDCLFFECSNLTEVSCSSKLTIIGDSAFDYCSNLETINLPDSLTIIGDYAFDENTSLKNLILPKNLTKIGYSAFYNCSNLSKVIIPESVTFIDESAFGGISVNATIIYSGTLEQWAKIEIGDDNDTIINNVKNCDHSLTITINQVDATCTTEGYTGDKQCDTCKKIVETGTVIPMKDHTPVIDAAVAPTCTETGLTEGSHCEVCNTMITAQTVVPALGHDYAADYTVDTAPTCTAAGSQSGHCTRCGAVDESSKQEVAALGHDYVSKVTTAPTCTKDGVQTDTCSRCGDVQTTALKATGHQWSNWTKISDATVFATEQQQRTCQTCGEKETKEVGATLAPTATVNASTVTLKVKQSTKGLKVTDLAAGDSVASWKSTNTKVFTVKGNADGTCTLKGLKKGSAKLEITLASGMMKIITVKVQPSAVKTTKVTVPAKKLTVQKGTKASLKPVVTPFTSLQKVTYTSSNKKVVTVTKRGVITAKQAGTAKITIKSGSKKAVVTVTVPKTKTTGITVTKEVTVKKGKTYSLKAKVAPKNSDEKITYTSANKKVATVSKTGKIKGVKKGTTTITVKSGSQTVKVQVTVK